MKGILLLLLIYFNGFAQASSFTLEVDATAQTCLGNGTLTFNVTGNAASAAIEYKVFLLPNTDTPVTTVTVNSVSGLVAGEYLVTATQLISGQPNTTSATATITDEVIPFTYETQLASVQCGQDGSITVIITSGIGVSYEIISGPQLRPLQTSPVFSGLPVGQYQVRVHNNCGDAYVVTVQLLQTEPQFYISENFFPGGELNECGTIAVGHTYTNNNTMVWPVTFEYKVYPPGGGPPVTVVHDDIWNYNAGQSILTDIPFYNGQEYTYDIKITDGCGNNYTRYANVVNKEIIAGLEVASSGCGDYFLSVQPSNFVLPFSVSFVEAPAGFNPQSFNTSHPVSNTATIVYGDQNNPLPIGSYTVQITDACGNITSSQIAIGSQVQPNVEVLVNDYCVGSIGIQIPLGYITSGTLITAPGNYQSQLPQNMNQFITGGQLLMNNMPIGDYAFTVTDGCGFTYNIAVELLSPPYDPNLYAAVIPGCSENEGSVMLYADDSMLETVTIIAAPEMFEQALPYDASNGISTAGIATLLSLPAGMYTFETVDKCGNIRTKQVNVTGLEVYSNTTQVVRNCDSFDIDLQYDSNLTAYDSYWLQKYNEASGTWGHPETGVPYTQPDISLFQSSIMLFNEEINYNFDFEGKFRVLRVVHYFGNMNNECAEAIYEFVYYDNPAIIAAYSFPCQNGLSGVVIDAVGAAPLQYAITTMNGSPYVVENAGSNLFSGLTDAIYNFRVTDACNNIINIQYNPLDLEPFEITEEGFCTGESSSLSVPLYSFMSYEWWKEPGNILSTGNTLEFETFSTEDSGMYYLKITSNTPGSCIDTVLEHYVSPNAEPNSGQDSTATICSSGEYDLFSFINGAYSEGGIWEDTDGSGALTGHICNAENLNSGTYHFKYKTTGCSSVDEAIVTLTVVEAAAAPVAMVKGDMCEGGSIQLVVEDVANAVYQWTGPNNFTSTAQFPMINNTTTAASGQYTCVAIVNGCASFPVHLNVEIKAIPQFTISGNNTLCSGTDSELTVIAENFDPASCTYKWYHNGDLQHGVNAASIFVSEPGKYRVVVANGECEFFEEIEIGTAGNAFEVQLESGCRENECVISVINLDNLTDSAFEWTGPNGYTATGRQITITGYELGEYHVTVTNDEGCIATAMANVQSTECQVPKGISPGDGSHNNNFDLSHLGVKHIQIFNRYGLQVYEKAEYKNEWNGQSDKGDLPAGTYYYVLSLETGKQMTGWVYLKREN